MTSTVYCDTRKKDSAPPFNPELSAASLTAAEPVSQELVEVQGVVRTEQVIVLSEL